MDLIPSLQNLFHRNVIEEGFVLSGGVRLCSEHLSSVATKLWKACFKMKMRSCLNLFNWDHGNGTLPGIQTKMQHRVADEEKCVWNSKQDMNKFGGI
ncbi:hypothetical protein VNO78_27681 [Psophocarpus tetragonolobus]|uniref:Uncharacterized protein n=1 Tax=Psophocarpus tetragonolobus TaxID=3891 RepID=A0AAN9S1Y3_PSOTE